MVGQVEGWECVHNKLVRLHTTCINMKATAPDGNLEISLLYVANEDHVVYYVHDYRKTARWI